MEADKRGALKKMKYCGNCKPEVHPRRIRSIVERIAAGKESDILVLVNGCSRECLTKSKNVYPDRIIVSVNAGELVANNEEPGGEEQ